MATPTWIKDLLRGGLPEVLDLGGQADGFQETPTPERIPPSDNSTLERANPTNGGFMNLSSEQILTFTALAVGGLFVLNMLKKA